MKELEFENVSLKTIYSPSYLQSENNSKQKGTINEEYRKSLREKGKKLITPINKNKNNSRLITTKTGIPHFDTTLLKSQ